MTKPEITGKRDLRFSQWIRTNLPDSGGGAFLVTDLDFILCSIKYKLLMLLECKTRNKSIQNWQRNIFDILDKCIKYALPKIMPEWEYKGFHVIKFENTFFDNGKVYLDGQEIDEEGLRYFLSMGMES